MAQFQEMVVTMEDTAVQLTKDFVLSFVSMGNTVTSYAQESVSKWPYVTIPFFEVHGSDSRAIALTNVFAMCPLVAEPERTQWEGYAVDNQWWLIGNQTKAYSLEQEAALAQVEQARGGIPEYIYRMVGGQLTTVDLRPGPYCF